jgi:hypothetical protein
MLFKYGRMIVDLVPDLLPSFLLYLKGLHQMVHLMNGVPQFGILINNRGYFQAIAYFYVK